MNHEELLSKEELVRTFFESFNNSEVEEILRIVKGYPFVRPIAIGMASYCLRKFKDNFSKELFFWLILMSLKLDEGDICLRLNEESILELIKENVFPKGMTDESIYTLAKNTVVAFIENTLNTPISADNTLISSDKDRKTPLIAYRFEDKSQARIYLRSFYCYESSLADFIKEKAKDESLDEEHKNSLKNSLNILFGSADGKKVNYQKVAAALSCTSPFTVICGGPGTGKTTTVLRILLLLLANSNDSNIRIKLAAPTGKAAGRMVESIVSQIKSFNEVALKLFNQDEDLMNQRLSQIPHESSTVHSLLKVHPHNEIPTYNEENKLPCDILVVDEISMISLGMFSKLISAIDDNTRVIMLGDKDQLCSVEPGSVLSDICSVLSNEKSLSDDKLALLSDLTGYSKDEINAKKDGLNIVSDNVLLLVDSWRFSSESKLGKLANLVNNSIGKDPSSIKATFDDLVTVNQDENTLFVDDKNTEVTLNYIDDSKKNRFALKALSSKIAKTMVDFYSPENMYLGYLKANNFVIRETEKMSKTVFSLLDKYRILCANRRGSLGVEEINEKVNNNIRQIYRKDKDLKEYSDDVFYPGAVIMVTRNDRFLNLENGDIGFVAYQSEAEREKHKAKVFFPPKQGDKPRIVSPERISDYESGFAITIHKSQGSEYQNVCMVLAEKYNPILTKELVYTGLTRAKSEKVDDRIEGGIVSIITDEKILAEAIQTKVNRESGLALMLNKN
ncbi:MAG: exodeoxyribonuclease V subunit alpha [Aeromonadales bacterium]|nr:exodeoxyribonuclease V subunit alpha [Aeromonadales bacterium]